jgi:hypothetical protein
MSDIPASQTVISNALNQLTQLAPSSDIAQKGVEVLTKHLAGNVLSLSKNSGVLSKNALLTNPDIQGNIQNNQAHQVKLALNSNTTNLPTLEFFSPASKQSINVISLTEKQLQALLSLPAKQLLLSSPLAASKETLTFARLNATVMSPLATDLTQEKLPIPAQNVDAKPLTQQTALQQPATQLRLSLSDFRPPIEISLPIKSAVPFAAGDKVSLAISPKGVNWQVNIMPNTGQTSSQNSESVSVKLTNIQNVPNQNTVLSPQVSSETSKNTQQLITTNVPVVATPNLSNQQILLTPQQASPLIQASLQGQPSTKPITLELPLKAVIQQLNKINTEESQAIVQKLQSAPLDKLAIQVSANGEAKLLLQTNKAVASIVINQELAKQLAPLRLPNQQSLQNILQANTKLSRSQSNSLATQIQTQTNTANLIDKASGEGMKQATDPIKNPASGANLTANNLTQTSEFKNKTADTPLNLKEASAQLLNVIRDIPSGQSIITPELMNNKNQQANLLQSLLRIVKANAETPAVTIQSIEKALSDPEFFKASSELSGKQLVEQLLQQIKQTLPQGKEQDSNQIKQLLSAPALNLSALQMVSPAPSQGIMGGLITLLQISLSARLARSQTGRSEQISKVLNDFLGSSTDNTKSTVTPKALTDLSQLEQKHNLMKEIGRLISGHQTNKLSNAEQMLQGQDSFYYNLPSALGGNLKDIELLIKREEHHKEQSTEQATNKTWQLTMKLSVGEIGELLTKAKLREDNLELNFYASNEALKNQVLNYLPLLRRKLDSLGIEMSNSHCQLGKIPDTLQQRPYHVFQAKA